MEVSEFEKAQITNRLRYVYHLNRYIKRLTTERNGNLDPLVRKYGSTTIDELYAEVELESKAVNSS